MAKSIRPPERHASISASGRRFVFSEITPKVIGATYPERIALKLAYVLGPMQRLFQPYTQVDTSIARRYGGTGLGLSIVKGLVERMHGRISVRSSPGQGSRFTVEVPLPQAV